MYFVMNQTAKKKAYNINKAQYTHSAGKLGLVT